MATVMLDAGHGGYDNGASFEGRKEKDDNLNLVLAIGNILENNGVDVLYTRTTDIYQSPNEKANIANRSERLYFVPYTEIPARSQTRIPVYRHLFMQMQVFRHCLHKISTVSLKK